jgi:hypothetical protein
MNEIVNQLAEQAKASIPPGTLSVDQWIEQYNQKFAQLIINECAIVADKETSNPAGCGWVTKTTGDRIREYFNEQR